MAKVCYIVIATLPSRQLADEYVAWLEDGHVDQVIDAGAHSAMIVRLERSDSDLLPKDSLRVMTQYIFSTRETFDHYLRHHAPALRAEGMKKFPAERGVRIERSVGEIA